MNQIKKDLILGVHTNHQLTCPYINALQFIENKSSKTYEVELFNSPKHLLINTDELLSAMKDLDKWAYEIIELYKKLPEDIQHKIEEEGKTQNRISHISEYLEIRCEDKIKEYETNVNKAINRWENDHQDYTESIETIKSLEYSVQENEFVMNQTKKADVKIILAEEIKEDKLTIQSLNDYTDTLLEDFENNVREQFDKYTFEFSYYLEMVRRRNNEIREQVHELRDDIIAIAKHKMGYYQPIEYLNHKFGVVDKLSSEKSINIGIINNETDYGNIVDFNKDGKWYFLKMVAYLESKNGVTAEQKKMVTDEMENNKNMKDPEYRKGKLFKLLQENGYKTIRYYDSLKDYTNNPESPKIKSYTETLKRKMKP